VPFSAPGADVLVALTDEEEASICLVTSMMANAEEADMEVGILVAVALLSLQGQVNPLLLLLTFFCLFRTTSSTMEPSCQICVASFFRLEVKKNEATQIIMEEVPRTDEGKETLREETQMCKRLWDRK